PQVATRELMPHLSHGHQVVLPDIGHSDDFWGYEPAAGDRLVNTFFDTGRVDTSLYTRTQLDFTPSVGYSLIAKILLSVILGFAGLTFLSLAWMAFRVARRGELGRKSGAVVRTAYAGVLGIGGWFAGLLLVLTTMPTVPPDSDLLAGIAVGTTVGAAVY